MRPKSGGNVRKPVSVARSKRGKVYDSLKPNSAAFEYTCILIPRIPSYKLTKKHAEISSAGLEMICLSNGWKLEFVNVNAKYLHWAVTAVSPVKMVDLISQVRSGLNERVRPLHKIIGSRSVFDFWAEGYLMLHGLHPDPGAIIDQYILLIRRHQ